MSYETSTAVRQKSAEKSAVFTEGRDAIRAEAGRKNVAGDRRSSN